MVAHAERLVDHRRHALGGPHLTNETVRFRSLRQQVRQRRTLLGSQLRHRAWCRSVAERRHSRRAGPLQPAAHRSLADFQRFGNLLATPTLLMQFPGADAPPLPYVLSAGPCITHTARSTTPSADSPIQAAVSNNRRNRAGKLHAGDPMWRAGASIMAGSLDAIREHEASVRCGDDEPVHSPGDQN